MIRAVLDANVLVSGILGISRDTDSAPSLVLRHWAAGQFDLAISDHILDEVRRTLTKPWFAKRISSTDIDAVLIPMLRSSIYVSVRGGTSHPAIASHIEDDFVLATVDAADADLLVTGDTMLLKLSSHRRAQVVSARQFLEMLELG